MRPVCVKCGKEMECALNGVLVVHPFEHPEPGPVQETVGDITMVNMDRLMEGSWKDGDLDFIAYGDKYRCESCGSEIVTGFGGEIMRPQKILRKMIEANRKAELDVIEIRRGR